MRWVRACGTTLNDEQVFAAASGRHPEDYFVFVMTGTNDFAVVRDNLVPRALRRLSGRRMRFVGDRSDSLEELRADRG